MKKKYKTHPFEFLFLINGNPIVGRNFPINNYNRDSLNSYELKETIDDTAECDRDWETEIQRGVFYTSSS